MLSMAPLTFNYDTRGSLLYSGADHVLFAAGYFDDWRQADQ